MIRCKRDSEYDLEDLGVDLTSMLDIIFILLIFFILTANAPQFAFEIKLPTKGAEQSQPLQTEPVTLGLYQDGVWKLDTAEYHAWSDARNALTSFVANHPDVQLVIAAERDVSVEKLLEVMTFLQQQNITTAKILMEKRNF